MPTGAAIGAATIGAAAIGSGAAKSAAKTESQAATNASNVQQQMYGQTRSDLQPFRDFGSSALSPYAKLLGITGDAGPQVGAQDWAGYVNSNPDLLADFNRPEQQAAFGGDINAYGQAHYASSGQAEGRQVPTFSAATIPKSGVQTALENIPGYQFMRDQGIQSVERSLGSRGQTGAQAKGIARFVTGLADSTYGEQVGRLGAAAGVGGNAAAMTGQIGANYSGQIGSNIVGAGQAGAAGIVGGANAITSGLGTAANYAYGNKILGMYGGGGSPVQTSTGPGGYVGVDPVGLY